MRSDFKPACLWAWPLLAWQPLVRFQSNYLVLSFPCWRSTELPSLPICPPCSLLPLNLFLLHLPCCCRGLGHGAGFHLLSCDDSELVAFGLCSTGLLGAVCGVEMLWTLWVNQPPGYKGWDPVPPRSCVTAPLSPRDLSTLALGAWAWRS